MSYHRATRRATAHGATFLSLATLLLFATLAATTATAAESAVRAKCSNRLPQVLDVALPYPEDANVDGAREPLEAITTRWHRGSQLRCPVRPLQVNVAFGSDYQILDWLDRGEVDVGVVSTLSHHLLRRDAIDLLPVPLQAPDDDACEPTPRGLEERVPPTLPGLDERAARFRAHNITGAATGVGETVEGGATEALFEELLGECLEAALADGDRDDPRAHHRPQSGLRLVLPSHLSTVGFLEPIRKAKGWLTEEAQRKRLDEHVEALSPQRAEHERQRIDDRFWEALLGRSCFHFDTARARGDDKPEDPVCPLHVRRDVPPPATEIEIVAVPLDKAATGEDGGDFLPPPAAYGTEQARGFRDHLMIRRSAFESVFRATGDDEAEESRPRLPPELERLFGSAGDGRSATAARVPPPFRSHLQPEPYYDTRTFAFSLDESVALLRQHQRTSERTQLALVLPGGGVKAAYQTKLLDHLYATGELRNYRLGVGERADDDGPLDVVYVIGTSGGALIGYFVARLGPDGPFALSDILWDKDPADGEAHRDLVDSGDIFPFNDLPRYLSLVAILFVLLAFVAVASLRGRGWLSPDRAGAAAPPAAPRALRVALLLPLFLVVAATPFLVRWVNGEASLEHVPEFEGLLFAVLLVVSMFADHCVVYGAEEERRERFTDTWISPALLVVLGLTLLALPALARWFPGLEGMLADNVTAGVAAVVLGLPIAGLALGVTRLADAERRHLEPLYWLAGFLVGLVTAWLVLQLLGRLGLLHLFDRLPLIFFGLFAVLGFIVVQRRLRAWQERRAARGDDAADDWIDRALASRAVHRGLEWHRHRTTQRILSLLPLVAACLLILDFTRPPAQVFVTTPIHRLPFAVSRLVTPFGGFAVCVGALLVVVGLVLHLHRRANRYTLSGVRAFVDAALVLILSFAGAVYLALLAASRIPWFEITLFELTVGFWKGLLTFSFLFAWALLAWARWAGERNRAARWANGALRYLASRHPNSRLVGRRFLRLGLVAIGGLVWWNLVLAPGFYGNEIARDYLVAAAARFDNRFAEEHPGATNRLTAKLLTPANALEVDGTRYILAVPGEEPCPTIRQPPGSGSVWHYFQVVPEDADAESEPPCRLVSLPGTDGVATDGGKRDLTLLEAAVFASGSPFPIFPAHRIGFGDGGSKEALVDGGYTNLVPVDAATDVGAEQVLIVNSSHPLPRGGERTDPPTGPLVDNFLRLPGFLYERAQQIDRRSRAGLFVVSLSPAPQADWPLLTDFRSEVVERMWAAAEQDLDERIGMVESWGPPRFLLSLRVEGQRPTTIPEDPCAPAPAPSR